MPVSEPWITARFLFYNIMGGITWACVVVLGGYYFGTIPVVQENMSLLIFLVILVTAGTLFLVFAGLVSGHMAKRRASLKKKRK